MPGRYLAGVHAPNVSTPRFIHGPSRVSWMTAAMLDFPERGAPLRMMIWPGSVGCVTPSSFVASRLPKGQRGSVAMTSDSRIAAIWELVHPANVRRTSSLCWPKHGAGRI